MKRIWNALCILGASIALILLTGTTDALASGTGNPAT